MNLSETHGVGFNPEAIAQGVADKQRLDDAQKMCDSLVADVDGDWLIGVLKKVRQGPVSRDGRTGIAYSEARTFHFRSSQPLHNLDPISEKAHYRSFAAPAGFHVVKVGGAGFRTWTLRVHNRLAGDDEAYINLQYNSLQSPIIVRYFRAKYDRPTGRRASTRMRGSGPDKSL